MLIAKAAALNGSPQGLNVSVRASGHPEHSTNTHQRSYSTSSMSERTADRTMIAFLALFWVFVLAVYFRFRNDEMNPDS